MSQPHDTRERILSAALRLFGERGFIGTTITAIEAAAGLTAGSGSFYRHFKSKEDVFETALSWEFSRVLAAYAAQRAVEAEPVGDELVVWASKGLRRLEELQPLLSVLMRESTPSGQPTSAATAPGVRHAIDRLREAAIEGSVGALTARIRRRADRPPARAADDAVVMISAVIGYHVSRALFALPPGGMDADAFAAALGDRFRGDGRPSGD